MEIFIKTEFKEKCIVLHVDGKDTIGDIKERISKKEGILINEQNLDIEGKRLEDRKTLSDYGVSKGDTISLKWKSSSLVRLPSDEDWKTFESALKERPRNLTEFNARSSRYLTYSSKRSGLQTLLAQFPDMAKRFFTKILPFIDKMALELPSLLHSKNLKYDRIPKDWKIGMRFCPILEPFPRSNAPSKVFIDRRLVLSLLSNCFLCSLPGTSRDMPSNNFFDLFVSGNASQEIAKLRMILNYFERCMNSIPKGKIEIHRCSVDSSSMTLKKWTKTEIPLGEIALVKLRFGLEETYHENPPLLQVDFANMYLGVRFSSRLSLYIPPHSHIHFRVVCSLVDVFKRRFDFQSLPS